VGVLIPIERLQERYLPCPWCHGADGAPLGPGDLVWSVRIPADLPPRYRRGVLYCFACGRKLEDDI